MYIPRARLTASRSLQWIPGHAAARTRLLSLKPTNLPRDMALRSPTESINTPRHFATSQTFQFRKELQKKLYADFPDLYSQRPGFNCGDGWYDIVYRLSEQITALVANIPGAKPRDFCAVQVKEKIGGLRFYMSKCTDEISEVIHKAEDEAHEVCENCGREGELRNISRLYLTLCDGCTLYRVTPSLREKRKHEFEEKSVC